MSLNAAQALSLATSLRVLEERCDQMQRLVAGAVHDGALHRIIQDIPVDTRWVLRDHLASLRGDIAQMAADFQLTGGPQSARQMLVALLAASWQDLEDERPAKLRRYGPVDAAVIPSLDVSVSQIIACIKEIQILL